MYIYFQGLYDIKCWYIYTLFPFLRFTFLEISIVLYLPKKKNAICLKIYFIIILNVIASCIYIDNGM